MHQQDIRVDQMCNLRETSHELQRIVLPSSQYFRWVGFHSMMHQDASRCSRYPAALILSQI